jgi:hypothetical protein
MNSLFIGNSIDTDTQSMTIHFDGSIIRLLPFCDEDNRIKMDVVVNDETLLTADPTSSHKITIPGNTKEHTLHLKHKLKYDKYEPTKFKLETNTIVCSIDKIPLHHTKKDPMNILHSGYSGILIFMTILAYRIVVVSIDGINIVDVIGFGILAAISIASFFLYRRHHVVALVLALFVMVFESTDLAWSIIQSGNLDASEATFKAIASIFVWRGIGILLTVRGLIAGMKINDLNREIHNKLVTTA